MPVSEGWEIREQGNPSKREWFATLDCKYRVQALDIERRKALITNFGGLDLDYVEADFLEAMAHILQHLSKFTRFAYLCTSPNSSIADSLQCLNCIPQNLAIVHRCWKMLLNFRENRVTLRSSSPLTSTKKEEHLCGVVGAPREAWENSSENDGIEKLTSKEIMMKGLEAL